MGDFLGLTADGWIAIATFCSGGAVLAGILFGARQFTRQQEAQDVRRYLLDNGAWRLKASLDGLLGTVRQNYAIAHHLLRNVRDLPRGHAGAPRAEDLPRLLPSESDLAFDAVRATSVLLDCEEVGPLATHAYASIYNVQTLFLAEIEQSIRTYYAGSTELSDSERRQLVAGLSEVLDQKYRDAEEFRMLPGWIEAAGVQVQRLKIAKFSEIPRLQRDKAVKDLAKNVREMWQRLRPPDYP